MVSMLRCLPGMVAPTGITVAHVPGTPQGPSYPPGKKSSKDRQKPRLSPAYEGKDGAPESACPEAVGVEATTPAGERPYQPPTRPVYRCWWPQGNRWASPPARRPGAGGVAWPDA